MSANASALTAARSPAGPLAAARALVAGRIHVVQRLIGMGAQIAARCWRGAGAPGANSTSPVSFDWLSLAHAKVWRALQLAVFLRARLLALAALVGRGDARKARRALDKAGLGGIAWGDLDEAPEAPKVEQMARLERLPTLDGLLGPDPLRRYAMSRPVGEVIAEIRDGLGVTPEWLAEVEAAWAAAQAADEAKGLAESSKDAAPTRAPAGAIAAPPSAPPAHSPLARRLLSTTARRLSGLPPRPT